jgi:hypothetical protein
MQQTNFRCVPQPGRPVAMLIDTDLVLTSGTESGTESIENGTKSA